MLKLKDDDNMTFSYPEIEIFKAPEDLSVFERATRTCYKSEEKMKDGSDYALLNMIMSKNHTAMIEFIDDLVVRFKTSRGVTHELVRMRLCSFCLSGDTKILRYNQRRNHLTIKELYERDNNPTLKCKNDSMLIRSMNEDGIIVPNSIKRVVYSGVKDMYQVKTSLGYTIKTSKNHIFFTPYGETKLKNLNVSDKVFVNGVNLIKNKSWLKNNLDSGLSISAIAEKSGTAYSTVRKYIREFGLSRPIGYKPSRPTPWNKGLSEFDDDRIKNQANALRENHHNNGFGENNSAWKNEDLTDSGYRCRFSKYPKEICECCGSAENLENHHRDKNVKNWREANKITLCGKCHKLYHFGYNVKHVVADEIVSIEYVGKEECYDIEMNDPFHNFVAEGFVVHNSQESQRYVKYDSVDFIIPHWLSKKEILEEDSANKDLFVSACESSANNYKSRIEAKWTPQDARGCLNNDVSTLINVKTNLREWLHIFGLRCDAPAHPDMRLLMIGLLGHLNNNNEIVKALLVHKPELQKDLDWFNKTHSLGYKTENHFVIVSDKDL